MTGEHALPVKMPSPYNFRDNFNLQTVVVVDNLTIPKGGYISENYDLDTVNPGVISDGWDPLIMSELIIGNATNSGSNSSYCSCYSYSISHATNQINVRIRNNNTGAAAKVKISCRILYVKT